MVEKFAKKLMFGNIVTILRMDYSRYGSSGSFAPPPLQSDLAGRCSLLTKLFVYVFSIAVCLYLIAIVSGMLLISCLSY